jgi:hypothetical protein
LRPHPPEYLVQQQRDEEHPLGVPEMGDRQDRDTRLSGLGHEERADVERLPFHPRCVARRSEQVVEREHQLESLFCRIERLHVQHADLLERGLLHRVDEIRQGHVAPELPLAFEQRR